MKRRSSEDSDESSEEEEEEGVHQRRVRSQLFNALQGVPGLPHYLRRHLANVQAQAPVIQGQAVVDPYVEMLEKVPDVDFDQPLPESAQIQSYNRQIATDFPDFVYRFMDPTERTSSRTPEPCKIFKFQSFRFAGSDKLSDIKREFRIQQPGINVNKLRIVSNRERYAVLPMRWNQRTDTWEFGEENFHTFFTGYGVFLAVPLTEMAEFEEWRGKANNAAIAVPFTIGGYDVFMLRKARFTQKFVDPMTKKGSGAINSTPSRFEQYITNLLSQGCRKSIARTLRDYGYTRAYKKRVIKDKISFAPNGDAIIKAKISKTAQHEPIKRKNKDLILPRPATKQARPDSELLIPNPPPIIHDERALPAPTSSPAKATTNVAVTPAGKRRITPIVPTDDGPGKGKKPIEFTGLPPGERAKIAVNKNITGWEKALAATAEDPDAQDYIYSLAHADYPPDVRERVNHHLKTFIKRYPSFKVPPLTEKNKELVFDLIADPKISKEEIEDAIESLKEKEIKALQRKEKREKAKKEKEKQ